MRQTSFRTASWVSGCFVWLLHAHRRLQLSLLSRSQFLMSPFSTHIACAIPSLCRHFIFFSLSRHLCLSCRCFLLPPAFHQTCVLYATSLTQGAFFAVARGLTLAWCYWEQDDLSESLELKKKSVHVNTRARCHLLPVWHYAIPLIPVPLKHC